jgi:GTP-binding protein HflX
LIEIANIAKEEGSKILIYDCELTASQIRNIKDLTNLPVMDRCQVILEIFAQHARTKEAKIQIEISRLQYLLPRLTGLWSHLGRQKGGVGVRGGEGEQQIELDRRIIRERIQFFKEELKTIIKSRTQQGKKRKNKAITAALVGYTNAGKSSVMNRLCKVNVLEENKLFATLDSTYRMLNPDTKPPMVLIDTVGFISNLPATLIEGFKTTLESAIEADLLIIVCDISDPHFRTHLEVTEKVLKDLSISEKEKIIVFNKKDLLHDELKKKIIHRTFPNSFLISSYDEKDITNLRKHIIDFFLEKQDTFDLFIPYENGDAHAKVSKNTNIIKSLNHERGIFYRIKVPDFIFDGLGLEKFILSPKDEIYKSFSI